MLKSQKLAKQMREKAEMLDKLAPGSKQYVTLSQELMTLIPEYSEALLKDNTRQAGLDVHATPEHIEKMRLYSEYKVTNVFQGLKSGRLTGVEAEVAQEHGLEQNEIPFDVWEADRPKVDKTVTGAPGTVGVNLQPIVPFVFAPTIAEGQGITFVDVPSGTFAVPAITTALSAGAREKDSTVNATAAKFTVHTMTPKSVSSRLELLIEDIFAAGTNLESAVRQNMSMVLSSAMDNQMINGSGSGADLSGLFKALTDPAQDGTVLTFKHGIEKLAGLVDGTWAMSTQDVALLVGVETYQLAGKLTNIPATGGQGETTLADYLREHTAGFTTNSRMPVKASHKQAAIAYRKGMSGMTTAIIPSWGRIQIEDMYTGSAKGQKNITLHAIVGDVKVLQPGAYEQVEFAVSS